VLLGVFVVLLARSHVRARHERPPRLSKALPMS